MKGEHSCGFAITAVPNQLHRFQLAKNAESTLLLGNDGQFNPLFSR